MTSHLILGGARSGKSAFAEQLARQSGRPVTVVVTAEPFDDGMRQRISRHQQDRPVDWTTIEAPLDLADAIDRLPAGHCAIVDCLTLWLNNQIFHTPEQPLLVKITKLCELVVLCRADLILVSNEVGLGIVPMGETTRQFVDHAGWMNQALARVCDRVTLVTAGLPFTLKG